MRRTVLVQIILFAFLFSFGASGCAEGNIIHGDHSITQNTDNMDLFSVWRVVETTFETPYQLLRKQYIYDESGKLEKIIEKEGESTEVFNATCDKNGNVLLLQKEADEHGYIVEYTYDQYGNTLSRTTYYDGKKSDETVNTYNENGLLLTEIFTLVSGHYQKKTTYEYNELGDIAKVTCVVDQGDFVWHTIEEYVYKNGFLFEIHCYDEWGNPTESVAVECNTSGKPTKMTSYLAMTLEVTKVKTIEYDEYGHEIHVMSVDRNGNILSCTTTVYRLFEYKTHRSV